MEATKSDVHINIDIPETNIRGGFLGCMKMKSTFPEPEVSKRREEQKYIGL